MRSARPPSRGIRSRSPPSCWLVLKSTIQRLPSATNVRSRRMCSSASPPAASIELRARVLVRPSTKRPLGSSSERDRAARHALGCTGSLRGLDAEQLQLVRECARFSPATRCAVQRSSPCSAMRCKCRCTTVPTCAAAWPAQTNSGRACAARTASRRDARGGRAPGRRSRGADAGIDRRRTVVCDVGRLALHAASPRSQPATRCASSEPDCRRRPRPRAAARRDAGARARASWRRRAAARARPRRAHASARRTKSVRRSPSSVARECRRRDATGLHRRRLVARRASATAARLVGGAARAPRPSSTTVSNSSPFARCIVMISMPCSRGASACGCTISSARCEHDGIVEIAAALGLRQQREELLRRKLLRVVVEAGGPAERVPGALDPAR